MTFRAEGGDPNLTAPTGAPAAPFMEPTVRPPALDGERSNGRIEWGVYAPNAPTLIDPKVLGLGGQETLERLNALNLEVGVRPDLILVISPHWVTSEGFQVQSSARPRFIEDFSGFPREMYGHLYAPPGDPEFARRLAEEGVRAGLQVAATEDWGLDHGAWTVLRPLAPSARIPVVALSISRAAPDRHLSWGRAVGRAVARSGRRVAIVSTGLLMHNFGRIRFDSSGPPWSEGMAIERELLELMMQGDPARVAQFDRRKWREVSPEGDLGPYFILAGALGSAFRPRLVSHERAFNGVGMPVVEFLRIRDGPPRPQGAGRARRGGALGVGSGHIRFRLSPARGGSGGTGSAEIEGRSSRSVVGPDEKERKREVVVVSRVRNRLGASTDRGARLHDLKDRVDRDRGPRSSQVVVQDERLGRSGGGRLGLDVHRALEGGGSADRELELQFRADRRGRGLGELPEVDDVPGGRRVDGVVRPGRREDGRSPDRRGKGGRKDGGLPADSHVGLGPIRERVGRMGRPAAILRRSSGDDEGGGRAEPHGEGDRRERRRDQDRSPRQSHSFQIGLHCILPGPRSYRWRVTGFPGRAR